MAEIFNFYVQDNRSIQFPKNNLLEPIMQEDHNVAVWRFRIPKVLNDIDMSGYAWWFVYVNAKGQEFSELLTLVDDIDEPDSFCTADYSIDYGISYHPGNFQFSLEAINADSGGEVLNEWHTKTYAHKVDKTLQGNQAQWAETESDIISALIIEVQNKVAQLVGGATPEPKNLVADMTDTKKVYLYVGNEEDESNGYWYYHNGTQFVPGGQYGAGGADPEVIEQAVTDWLDDHPEATTTVADGSITLAKLNVKALPFVTPEMFGAVGDGITNDTVAIRNALNYAMENGKILKFEEKTYGVIPDVSSSNRAHNLNTDSFHAFYITAPVEIDLNNATLQVLENTVVAWHMFLVFCRTGYITIKNGTMLGDRDTGPTGTHYDSTKFVFIIDSQNVTLENLVLKNSKGDAIGINGVQDTHGKAVPYPYEFEDFYMGINIRNCIIDKSNRNGITVAKCRGVVIDGCVITNTDGVAPKLGIDIEPSYGHGNSFQITIKNCYFSGNTMGCIGAYSPDDLTIINCTGGEGVTIRNCPDARITNSQLADVNIWGTNCTVDDCDTGLIKINRFSYTYDKVPDIHVRSTKCGGVNIPAATGSTFGDIIFENCAITADMALDAHGANTDYAKKLMFTNNVINLVGTADIAVKVFDTKNIADALIFKDNLIYVDGSGKFANAILGDFRGLGFLSFQFSNNKIIFGVIAEGVTRNPKNLFYRYKPSEDNVFSIDNNIINIEGNPIITATGAITVIDTSTANALVFARNNIFRGIATLNKTNDATIVLDTGNSYDNIVAST